MIIVMGASGFIGMYTVERLIADGKQVLATGRNEKMKPMLEKMGASFMTLDITNKEDYKKLPTEGVEGVLLLAGLLPANVNVDITKDENINRLCHYASVEWVRNRSRLLEDKDSPVDKGQTVFERLYAERGRL